MAYLPLENEIGAMALLPIAIVQFLLTVFLYICLPEVKLKAIDETAQRWIPRDNDEERFLLSESEFPATNYGAAIDCFSADGMHQRLSPKTAQTFNQNGSTTAF